MSDFMRIYIGVGSNLGDRSQNIQEARRHLEKNRIHVLRSSPLYETEAHCRPGQTMPPFINAVFEAETDGLPEGLLDRLEEIEREMGRTGKGSWQPRTIDLDILFYGNEVIHTPRLKIPHPAIENRWFVLKPLSDLIPAFKHPVTGKTIQEHLKNIF